MSKKPDIYTRVTNKIIADLEKGNLTWNTPWNADHLAGNITRPLRQNGEPYQGINTLILWGASVENGFTSNQWMTYKQAKELGGQVRKGSRSETVVYASKFRTEDDVLEEDGVTWQTLEVERRFLKAYNVFNVEQIDYLPEEYYQLPEPVTPGIERIDHLENFFRATGAKVGHGGNRAFYNITLDRIQMPHIESFRDAISYYATLGHETVHWTRHGSRLDREFGRKRFGDEGYAREELVAELGSAFLCADLGLAPEPREDHAAYIESWLTVLRNDRKAIFQAAAHAQRAVDFLHNLQPPWDMD